MWKSPAWKEFIFTFPWGIRWSKRRVLSKSSDNEATSILVAKYPLTPLLFHNFIFIAPFLSSCLPFRLSAYHSLINLFPCTPTLHHILWLFFAMSFFLCQHFEMIQQSWLCKSKTDSPCLPASVRASVNVRCYLGAVFFPSGTNVHHALTILSACAVLLCMCAD